MEAVGLSGKHIGILQSVREFPGFRALLAVFILRVLQEHRLSALSVLLLGAGVLLTGMAPFFSGLVFTTLVMSFGFLFERTNQSLTLQYFGTATSPKIFGRLRCLAAAGSKALVVVLYIPAHVFFNFSIAIRTYFQKVADPKDIAPAMAVGFTINHIAAVVLPAIGGFLWMVDYRILSWAGAVMSLVSLFAVQKIRTILRE